MTQPDIGWQMPSPTSHDATLTAPKEQTAP